jgi:Domain of unknown function (DUF1707)
LRERRFRTALRFQPDADTFGAPWVAHLEEAQAMGELQPRMRAGDQDRQRVVEQLGKHFGEGRLTVEEFDERVVRAHASVYLDELPALTADLPRDLEPHHRPPRSPMRMPSGPLVFFIAMLLAWSVVAAAIHGAPPFFALILLFVFLRHRRWSRRW